MDISINSQEKVGKEFFFKLLFYVALCLKLIQWDLSISLIKIQFNSNLIDILCLGLLLGSFFFRESYPVKLLIYFFLFSILSVMVYIKTGNRDILLMALFIFASYNIEFSNIIKCAMVIKSIFLILCTLLSILHIIPNYEFYEFRGVRKSLGYVTYNYAPRELFYIICYYIYLKKTKFKFIELIIIELLAFYYAQMTLSRTTFYLITLMVGIVVLNKLTLNKFFKTSFSRMISYIYILASVFTVVVLKLYMINPVKYKFLNFFTTGRLEYSIIALNKYGISLFGQKIEWVGLAFNQSKVIEYNYVDNSYLQMLLNYGIIYTIVVVVCLTLICRYAIRSNNYNLVIILVILAIRAIVEPQLWVVQYNIFSLLLLPTILMLNRKGV